MTKSQANRLGNKLRQPGPPDGDTLSQLQEFRAGYAEPMARAQARLRETLGIETTSRLKTVNTIVEKLRREQTRLSTMQDIAGLRTVLDREMGLAEQDAIVNRITGLFATARVDDRRERPSHGYRAVHVIAGYEGVLVEIQVRTEMQDLWAQRMEHLADALGRGIRYGEVPPDEVARRAVENLSMMSRVIEEIEYMREYLLRHTQGLPPDSRDSEQLVTVRASLAKLSEDMRSILVS